MGSLYSVSSTTGDVTTAGSFISNTTTSGLLFPRLTTAQRNAISSPSAGMQIYNTDTNKDEFYNGSVWGSIDTGITQLTSDVTAGPGSGSQAATVASVGGSSASNIHSAELAANAATNANTFSTIVKRDGSGNFSATTITASLTGHASADLALTGGTLTGDLTLANEHALIFNDTEMSPKSVTLEAPTTITTSYTLKWPVVQGTAGQTLSNDGSGNLSWTSSGGGATVTSYSPTISGAGTPTSVQFFYKSDGVSVEVWGSFVVGTADGSDAFVSLPVAADGAHVPTNGTLTGFEKRASETFALPVFLDGTDMNNMYVATVGAATDTTFTKTSGLSVWDDNTLVSFVFTYPIA